MSVLIPTQLSIGILIVEDGQVTHYSEELNNVLAKMLEYRLNTVLWRVDSKGWIYPMLNEANLDSFTGQVPVARYTINDTLANISLEKVQFGWIGICSYLVSSRSENISEVIDIGDPYDTARLIATSNNWKCGTNVYAGSGVSYIPIVKTTVGGRYPY